MNSALRRPPLVPRVDRAAPLQFLRTAYEADDWIAVFLKRYDTGEAVQRVGPVTWFQQAPVQAWLRLMNARHFNLYVASMPCCPKGVPGRGRRCVRSATCSSMSITMAVGCSRRSTRGVICRRRRTSSTPRPIACTSSGEPQALPRARSSSCRNILRANSGPIRPPRRARRPRDWWDFSAINTHLRCWCAPSTRDRRRCTRRRSFPSHRCRRAQPAPFECPCRGDHSMSLSGRGGTWPPCRRRLPVSTATSPRFARAADWCVASCSVTTTPSR